MEVCVYLVNSELLVSRLIRKNLVNFSLIEMRFLAELSERQLLVKDSFFHSVIDFCRVENETGILSSGLINRLFEALLANSCLRYHSGQ